MPTLAAMALRIRELKPDEMPSIWPLVRELNPALKKSVFAARLKPMLAQGYRCIGVFDGSALIAIGGFTITTRFWCGRQLDIDNLIVSAAHRGRKIGEKMMRWFEKRARAEGVEMLVLDSYTSNHASHSFYHREGYIIRGYHFSKDAPPA